MSKVDCTIGEARATPDVRGFLLLAGGINFRHHIRPNDSASRPALHELIGVTNRVRERRRKSPSSQRAGTGCKAGTKVVVRDGVPCGQTRHVER